MKSTMKTGYLINCLTNDEDLRQDLWVYYLSGNPVESLSDHLEKLVADRLTILNQEHIKAMMWKLLRDPVSERFLLFLNNFSDFEKSLMCLLALGCTVQEIATYKGISEMRIKQALHVIRYNNNWCTHYGIEETI